jgi:hypothetical protein
MKNHFTSGRLKSIAEISEGYGRKHPRLCNLRTKIEATLSRHDFSSPDATPIQEHRSFARSLR